MPPIIYWISGPALFLAGSFALTVILALIGIKDMIPSKWSLLIVGLGFVLMIMGMWVTARQEEKNAKAEKDSDRLVGSIDEIKKAMGIGLNVEVTPRSIIEALDAQRKAITDATLNNFLFFKLASDKPTVDGKMELVLDAHGGPVFTTNYWISLASANLNPDDAGYWAVDYRKPGLLPVINPGDGAIKRTLPISDYIIEYDALNGHWDEYFSVTRQGDKLIQSVKIVKRGGSVIYEQPPSQN
jgi:hypothetical protein